jgi:hypothetical protein
MIQIHSQKGSATEEKGKFLLTRYLPHNTHVYLSTIKTTVLNTMYNYYLQMYNMFKIPHI